MTIINTQTKCDGCRKSICDCADLPAGKTCHDCQHFDKCAWLFGCKPEATNCDFEPSRFQPLNPHTALLRAANERLQQLLGEPTNITTERLLDEADRVLAEMKAAREKEPRDIRRTSGKIV